jgi:hypothetical protein
MRYVMKKLAWCLVEPLSQRELGPQPAPGKGDRSAIARARQNTAYRKLDAANRTEAVAHARQLGILP